MAFATPQVRQADTFPWVAEARTNLNVRSGPGTEYSKLGVMDKGTQFYAFEQTSPYWVMIRYNGQMAYVSSEYINFISRVKIRKPGEELEVAGTAKAANSAKAKPDAPKGFWEIAYNVAKTIAWLAFIVNIIVSIFESELAGYPAMLWVFYLIGYVVGLIFGNSHIGATIGQMAGVLVFLGQLHMLGLDFSFWKNITGTLSFILWQLISFPFYFLNLLQFFLSKPWRYKMKRNWAKDADKKGYRTFFRVLQIPFYVISTPLRFVNAVYYNIVIHLLYETSNYFLEVVLPSDDREGHGNFFLWLVWLPLRVVIYLIYHLGLTVIESVVWTIVDTIIPALTLYHGTQSQFAEEMVCEPKRNRLRKEKSGWKTGTWTVGGGNYAGDGIYFGIARKTLNNYQSGAAIVTRVSMGKTIDVSLMPDKVYNTAGHADAHEVSRWGIMNGYTSGEWWRVGCNWWEICLYDRKNRYNYSWRIRPIYVLNYNSGIMQRVRGGTAHWLFRMMVIKDIGRSIGR